MYLTALESKVASKDIQKSLNIVISSVFNYKMKFYLEVHPFSFKIT